jgi:hypothetical protein
MGEKISCTFRQSPADNVAMKMTKRLLLSKTAAALQAIIMEFDMIITPYHAIFHQGEFKGSP